MAGMSDHQWDTGRHSAARAQEPPNQNPSKFPQSGVAQMTHPSRVDAHRTLNDLPEMASARIRTALTFLVDCVHTSAGINNGELKPKAGKLQLNGHTEPSEIHRRRGELALRAFAS